MAAQILEGTISEIQQGLGRLPYGPETRLRAIVTEQENTPTTPEERFRPVEFRNGVPLLPRRQTAEPVTLELVRRLLDEAETETLRAD